MYFLLCYEIHSLQFLNKLQDNVLKTMPLYDSEKITIFKVKIMYYFN